jgi:hypothetical protein
VCVCAGAGGRGGGATATARVCLYGPHLLQVNVNVVDANVEVIAHPLGAQQRKHDGEREDDVVGRLDQNNSQTDRHSHNAAQKRRSTHQRVPVCGRERGKEGAVRTVTTNRRLHDCGIALQIRWRQWSGEDGALGHDRLRHKDIHHTRGRGWSGVEVGAAGQGMGPKDVHAYYTNGKAI